jgi:lipopolysaccharide/colanic/teichoic acid biosynthesis glycosyltransferase
MLPKSLTYRTYTYPEQWFAQSGPDSGNGAHGRALLNRVPVWKRAMDIAGSLIGLTLLSPLLLATAVLIKIVSPGQAFLKQTRVGQYGRPFTIWKFRTMRPNADVGVHRHHLDRLIETDAPMTKLDVKRDPRIFPLGGLIRKCCIDELPQLINVLRGEMSLVGPRPCMPYEAAAYRLWQTARFDVLPGMTGLWQVSGKNKTTFKEMMRLDIRYARKASFWMDVSILVKTPTTIGSEMVAALLPWRTSYGPEG